MTIYCLIYFLFLSLGAIALANWVENWDRKEPKPKSENFSKTLWRKKP